MKRFNEKQEPLGRKIEVYSKIYIPAITALLDQVLQESMPNGSTVAAMCRYHLSTGGKRIRALLPMLIADSSGFDANKLVPFGAACEMLHNASLVHDDLQDGDILRRNHESIWYRFGASRAINLGDAMMCLALLCIGRLEISAIRREHVLSQMLDYMLWTIEGQDREICLQQIPSPSVDDYFEAVEGKTSGLFMLPMVGAANICGQSTEIIESLQEAALHMGVIFQIQDDLLDIFGNKGRDARANDIREGKRSILVIHALQNSTEPDRERLLDVLDKERNATTPEDIMQAIRIFGRMGSVSFAVQQIERRKGMAVGAGSLAEHRKLQSLISVICDYFLERIESLIELNDSGIEKAHASPDRSFGATERPTPSVRQRQADIASKQPMRKNERRKSS